MLLFWIYSLFGHAVITAALYIYHQSDQSSINSVVHNSFKREDGTIRYAIISNKGNRGYFTIPLTTNEKDKYTAQDIRGMAESLADIFPVRMDFLSGCWGSHGNKLALLLAYLFLCTYKREFLDGLIHTSQRKLPYLLNLRYCYIQDVPKK